MGKVIRVTDRNFDREVRQAQIPVLIDFWASWCPPCKVVEPSIDALAEHYDGQLKVAKMNVDQNPGTAARYQIVGLPSFVLFLSGEEIERRIGAQSMAQLQQLVSEVLRAAHR